MIKILYYVRGVPCFFVFVFLSEMWLYCTAPVLVLLSSPVQKLTTN